MTRLLRTDHIQRFDDISTEKLRLICEKYLGTGKSNSGLFSIAFKNKSEYDLFVPFDEFIILATEMNETMFVYSFRELNEPPINFSEIQEILEKKPIGASFWDELPEQDGTKFDYINSAAGWLVFLNATKYALIDLEKMGDLQKLKKVMEVFIREIRMVLCNKDIFIKPEFVELYPPPLNQINISTTPPLTHGENHEPGI